MMKGPATRETLRFGCVFRQTLRPKHLCPIVTFMKPQEGSVVQEPDWERDKAILCSFGDAVCVGQHRSVCGKAGPDSGALHRTGLKMSAEGPGQGVIPWEGKQPE